MARGAARALLLTFACAAAAPLPVAAAKATAAKARAAMTVRLILDLEDPITTEFVTAYERACKHAGQRCRYVVHHLPLDRHKRARRLATAAIAVRIAADHAGRPGDAAEFAFVRRLLSLRRLDDPAAEKAAAALGIPELNGGAFRRAWNDPATARALDRERATLVAMGVRATPSAIVAGRGIAGLPPERALQSAVTTAARGHKRCAGKGGSSVACEAAAARHHAPSAYPVFRALVTGRGIRNSGPENRPVGRLGKRFRVALSQGDIRVGPAGADVTAVFFMDPASARQRRALASLLPIARAQRDRVVIKLLPRERHGSRGAANLRVALACTAIALRGDPKTHARLAAVLAAEGDINPKLPGVAASAGLVGAALDTAGAAPATTVARDRILRGAARVDARPAAIYLNGRRWRGRPDDDGLDQVFELARTEAWRLRRKGVKAKRLYATLVGRGRVRSEAERDLEEAEDLGDLSALPDLGTAADPAKAVPVFLFVDFRSLASRAAFHILRGLRATPEHPVRLHVASMASSAEPAVTPSGAVFVAAHINRRGLDSARRLFAVSDPNDWRVLRAMWKRLGLNRKLLQPGVTHGRNKAVSATVRRLVKAFDMDADPVIYIGKRRYIGPIDEARIERAVAVVAKARKRRAAAESP